MVARYAIGRILTRTLQKANMRLTNSITIPLLWYEYVLNIFLTAIVDFSRSSQVKKFATTRTRTSDCWFNGISLTNYTNELKFLSN